MSAEYMIAVIDAVGVRSGRVDPNLEILAEEGFLVVDRTMLVISDAQAAALTSTSSGSNPRDFLSGPVEAVMLKRVDAFAKFVEILPDLDDTYGSCDTWSTLRDKMVFFPSSTFLERTLVVLKPEYTTEDLDAVMAAIESNDFVVVDKQARAITKEMAAELFPGDAATQEHVASDASVSLVLEKVGAVDEFNLLMGPTDPVLAKEIAPRSLRALLGKDAVKNAVYGSTSAEQAARDIEIRFPGPFAMERTLCLVKPDVVQNGYLNSVMEAIADNGFTVVASDSTFMSAERVEQVFTTTDANELAYMSSGPCMAVVLGKPGAVSAWKMLSKVLSARFGTDETRNGLYASPDAACAEKDIDAFFALGREKIPTTAEVEDILNDKAEPSTTAPAGKSLQDVLVEGLTQLCRVKPVGMDAVEWLGEWLLRNNPNKPVVEEPVEAAAALVVRDVISQGEQQSKIIWAVGAAGSGCAEQCASIVANHGYEFIDAEALVAVTEASGNEYGEFIKECKRLGRAVPTHIVTNLIKDAMLKAVGKQRFLVANFPSSLDMAFDFEKRLGEVDMLLYFECSEKARAVRLAASGAQPGDIKAFKEMIFPVIDHYSTFSKISKISTDGSGAQVSARVQRLFR